MSAIRSWSLGFILRGDFRRTRSRTTGFSLIELVVVIAVIAILAAISLTAVAGARRKAQQTQCAHNVRQLGLAMGTFLTEHGEYPLGLNFEFSQGKYLAHSTTWLSALQKQLESGAPRDSWTRLNRGVWDCPAASRPPESERAPREGYGEYGYNANGLGLAIDRTALGLGGHSVGIGYPQDVLPKNSPVKEGEVAAPSDLMAMGDGFSGWNGIVKDGGWALWRWRGVEERPGATKRSNRRHQGRANIVFGDGHVESPTLRSLFEETTDAALSRWNRDHHPHRERLAP